MGAQVEDTSNGGPHPRSSPCAWLIEWGPDRPWGYVVDWCPASALARARLEAEWARLDGKARAERLRIAGFAERPEEIPGSFLIPLYHWYG